MPKTTPRYIADEKGHKKAIVLNLPEYRRLLARLEELEDALDLDEAVKMAQGFDRYENVRKELKREGETSGIASSVMLRK